MDWSVFFQQYLALKITMDNYGKMNTTGIHFTAYRYIWHISNLSIFKLPLTPDF